MLHWMSERKQRSVEIPSCRVKNKMKIRRDGINISGNDITYIFMCVFKWPWYYALLDALSVYIFKPMYYVLIAVIGVTEITIISPYPYCTLYSYSQRNPFPLPLSLCQLFSRYTYPFLPSFLPFCWWRMKGLFMHTHFSYSSRNNAHK